MKFVSLYVTAASAREARKLAADLVENRLAACVNILGPVRSIYRWKGKVETGREVVLLAKTRATLADRAIRRIKVLHSYEVPCVVALPILKGHPAFLKWIADET